jgi:neurofibromin 1
MLQSRQVFSHYANWLRYDCQRLSTAWQPLLRVSQRYVMPLSNYARKADRQYSVSRPQADVSLEVHQSQAYLLHLLDSCLTATWRPRAETTTSQPSEIPRFWSDPTPLDDASARTLLGVLTTYLRFVSNETNPQSGTASPAPSNHGRGQSTAMVSWGHGGLLHPGSSTLPTSFLQSHFYPRINRGSDSREFDQFDCTDMSNIVDSVSQSTRYLGQIIFYLSSSNWNLVFSRIRSRLAYLTTTIEDMPDLIELRLLQWSNLNRARLCQLMQETSNVFLHIKRPSQIAFASVMHMELDRCQSRGIRHTGRIG